MAFAHKDFLTTDIVLDEPSEDERHRARLTVCEGAESLDDARELLYMLGLL